MCEKSCKIDGAELRANQSYEVSFKLASGAAGGEEKMFCWAEHEAIARDFFQKNTLNPPQGSDSTECLPVLEWRLRAVLFPTYHFVFRLFVSHVWRKMRLQKKISLKLVIFFKRIF